MVFLSPVRPALSSRFPDHAARGSRRRAMLPAGFAMGVVLSAALLPTAPPPTRAGSPCMMAKKPFKGGRLDDFLAAGEAEARFGPGRYAAVAEDAWRIEAKREKSKADIERSLELYNLQKTQWLSDHVFISLLGVAFVWSISSLLATQSFAFGAFFGGFYVFLKQREVDAWNPKTVEEARRAPPALVMPAIMMLAVAKNPDNLMIIPTLAGFFMQKISAVGQLVYDFDAALEKKSQ